MRATTSLDLLELAKRWYCARRFCPCMLLLLDTFKDRIQAMDVSIVHSMLLLGVHCFSHMQGSGASTRAKTRVKNPGDVNSGTLQRSLTQNSIAWYVIVVNIAGCRTCTNSEILLHWMLGLWYLTLHRTQKWRGTLWLKLKMVACWLRAATAVRVYWKSDPIFCWKFLLAEDSLCYAYQIYVPWFVAVTIADWRVASYYLFRLSKYYFQP